MVSILNAKLIIGIVVLLLISGLFYTVQDYFKLKTAYRISEGTVKKLQKQGEVLEEEMLKVEREHNENYSLQNKSVLEMDREGYISTPDGKNPSWMRYQANNGRH